MKDLASSRSYGKSTKPLVENAMALTVHRSRDADPDSCRPSFRVSVGARRGWDAVAIQVGELEFRVHFDPDPEYADDADPYARLVKIAETTCHFGGKRYWLVCANTRCRRRAARLFRLDDMLTCRTCAKLSYRSQRERAPLRALHKAQAIRRKLGGSGNLLEDFPDRPKWMHQITYLKYLWKASFWQRQYLEAVSARFTA